MSTVSLAVYLGLFLSGVFLGTFWGGGSSLESCDHSLRSAGGRKPRAATPAPSLDLDEALSPPATVVPAAPRGEEDESAPAKRPTAEPGSETSNSALECSRFCSGATDTGGALKTFKEIGDRHKDDKTFRHRYDIPYSTYLEPIRRALSGRAPAGDDKPGAPVFSMLEVGLGCDQIRIGASVALWSEYLPFARLATFEYDSKCGSKWLKEQQAAGKVGPQGGYALYFGDQANRGDLNKMLRQEDEAAQARGQSKMMYDFIVDDGGHTMVQQQVTFDVLWARLKKGGVYVIEDINTSFKTRYGGTRRPNCTSATTLNALVKPLIDKVHALPVSGHPGKFMEDLEFRSPYARVDCFHFVCFITKR